eukprot:s971_g29.t1
MPMEYVFHLNWKWLLQTTLDRSLISSSCWRYWWFSEEPMPLVERLAGTRVSSTSKMLGTFVPNDWSASLMRRPMKSTDFEMKLQPFAPRSRWLDGICRLPELDEKADEVYRLRDEVAALRAQIEMAGWNLPPPGTSLERQLQNVRNQLFNMEQSFWQKDQQLLQLDRKRMGLLRQVHLLRRWFQEARDLAIRTQVEVHNHAHLSCPVGGPIYMAGRGTVWHKNVECTQLTRSHQAGTVIERHACEACSCDRIPPFMYSGRTTTLAQDLEAFLSHELDNVDPEELAASAAQLMADQQERDRARAANELAAKQAHDREQARASDDLL